MRRWLLLLVFPIVLVAGALGSAYLYLTAQNQAVLRGELEEGLERTLGREVSIGGELEFRLRPLPAVTVSGISVANPDWALERRFLRVDRMDLLPSLPALLLGRVVIRSLDLDGVGLRLENGSDGTPNWRLPVEPHEDSESHIRIKAIEARNVEISYFNRDRGVTRTLKLDRLDVAAKRRTDPLEVSFSGAVLDLPLRGTGRLDSLAKLAGTERADFESDLRLGDSRLRLTGSVTDPDFRDYSGFDVDVELAGRRAVLLLDWTDLPIPEMRRFALRGRLIGDGGTLSLEDLGGDIEGNGYEIKVGGSARDLATMRDVDIRLEATGTDIDALLPSVELPSPVRGRFSVTGRLTGTRPAFALEDLKGRLEQERFELGVEGRIGDLRAGRELSLHAQVKADRVGLLAAGWGVSFPDLEAVELRGLIEGESNAPSVRDLTGRLREGGIEATFRGTVEDLAHLAGISLNFEGAGENLADLEGIFPIELPETESLSAAGHLTGSRQALDLQFERAELRLEDLHLTGTGSMSDLAEAPRVDLDVTLTGLDVRQGEALIGVELFPTDRFRIRGRLRGALSSPDLDGITAQFTNPQAILDVEGQIADVFGGKRLDLRPIFRGKNLAGLGALIGQNWPQTDSYTLRARLHGTWLSPVADDIDVQLTYPAGSLSARGRIGDLLGGRDVTLAVDARADSVTEFLPFGGRLWDRLGTVSGRFDLAGGPDTFVMAIDELTAGTSRLSGRFNLRFDAGALAYVHGDLDDSLLNVTPWLEDLGEQSGAASASPGDGERQLFSDEPLPLSWMDGLEMDVELAGNRIAIGGGLIDVATGELRVEDQHMRIDPFDIHYRGSDISGGFHLEGGAAPNAGVRAKAIGFDIGSLLRRSGLAPEAAGRVDLQLDLSAQGGSASAMAETADGRITLLMVGGSLGRANVQLRLTQVIASLVRREQRDIRVDCGMLDLPVSDGVGRINVFVLDTPDMLMRGEGKIDFGRETMDVLLLPRPKRGRTLAHNANVRIRGPILDARHTIDATDTATTVAGAVGRFALLGPAGLFINRNMFQRAHQECASTLAEVTGKP